MEAQLDIFQSDFAKTIFHGIQYLRHAKFKGNFRYFAFPLGPLPVSKPDM